MRLQAERTRLGVIDAFSAGFRMVTRHPWLLLPPILVDMLLWLLPRVSISPIFQPLWQVVQTTPPTVPDMGPMTNDASQLLQEVVNRYNLLSLLANGTLRFPSFITIQDGMAASTAHYTEEVIHLDSLATAFLLGLALFIISVVVASVYLRFLAWKAQEQPWDAGRFLRAVVRSWPPLALFAVALLAVLLFISVPLAMIAGVLSVLGPSVALLASSLLLLALFTLMLAIQTVGRLMLYFVVEAIVLDSVGLWEGLRRSVNIVLRNFWSTVGLVLLIFVLTQGFTIIWQSMAAAPTGTFIGILGNAYIGSGLAAALLIFYKDRRRRWQETSRPAQPPVMG